MGKLELSDEDRALLDKMISGDDKIESDNYKL